MPVKIFYEWTKSLTYFCCVRMEKKYADSASKHYLLPGLPRSYFTIVIIDSKKKVRMIHHIVIAFFITGGVGFLWNNDTINRFVDQVFQPSSTLVRLFFLIAHCHLWSSFLTSVSILKLLRCNFLMHKKTIPNLSKKHLIDLGKWKMTIWLWWSGESVA